MYLPMNKILTAAFFSFENFRYFGGRNFCLKEIITTLTDVINASLSEGIFPDEGKIAIIKPLFKKGDAELMENYRPISLLPAISKIEFAVQMTCDGCQNKIQNALDSLKGVNNINIDVENNTVVVETTLPSAVVQSQLESTGLKTVLKGYSSAKEPESGYSQQAAVAMLGGDTGYSYGKVKGVVRLVQLDNEHCVIDGTIDGLTPGKHGLHIHECGDISQGCHSVGEHFSLNNTSHGGPEDDASNRHTGDLGNIEADASGRATFRLVDRVLKVWDVVGRAMVVTQGVDDLGKTEAPSSQIDGNSGERLSCGIISRSAGVFENQKQICACDGVTIWEEQDRPVVGVGRRITQSSLCTYI